MAKCQLGIIRAAMVVCCLLLTASASNGLYLFHEASPSTSNHLNQQHLAMSSQNIAQPKPWSLQFQQSFEDDEDNSQHQELVADKDEQAVYLKCNNLEMLTGELIICTNPNNSRYKQYELLDMEPPSNQLDQRSKKSARPKYTPRFGRR